MNVEEAIRKRRSVRSYRDREIPEEDLKKILEAGRLAPSARNRQEWKFVVVKDEDKRKELVDAAAGQKFVGEAPVVIAAVSTDSEYIMRCGVPAYAVDLAIAVDHMTLQAVELGLGTCWIGAFYQDKVKKILGIPQDKKVVALLPVGYPADSSRKKDRKEFNEVVYYNKYNTNGGK